MEMVAAAAAAAAATTFPAVSQMGEQKDRGTKGGAPPTGAGRQAGRQTGRQVNGNRSRRNRRNGLGCGSGGSDRT